MKYLAIVDDDLLKYFRVDDNGLTLVAQDMGGGNRGIPLKPLIRPVLTNTEGESIYLTQAHIDALIEYERQVTTAEVLREINNRIKGAIDEYSGITKPTQIAGKKIEPIAIGQGCWKCPSHTKCFDAFQIHSYKCNHYDKTEAEFKEWLQGKKEKSGE